MLLIAILPALIATFPHFDKILMETPVATRRVFIPNMVSIQNASVHFCTGVLYNPQTLITSVQCQYDEYGKYSVVAYPSKERALALGEKLVFKVNAAYSVPGDAIAVWKIELVTGSGYAPMIALDDGKFSQVDSLASVVQWNLSAQAPFTTDMTSTGLRIVETSICQERFDLVEFSDICTVQYAAQPAIQPQARKNVKGYSPSETGTAIFSSGPDRGLVLIGISSNIKCDFQNSACVFFGVKDSLDWIKKLI